MGIKAERIGYGQSRCKKEKENVEKHAEYMGVELWSAANAMDPLFGMDEGAVRKEYKYLFEHATVVEAMLVALNHMQVDVFYLRGHKEARGHMTGFRKNRISFPQHLTELQQLVSFLSNLKPGDIVNAKRRGRKYAGRRNPGV